jgi:hypothetical protein
MELRSDAMEEPLPDTEQMLRRHHAVLTGVLHAHGDWLPRRVSARISAAADELRDPLILPALLAPDDPALQDPFRAVTDAIAGLRAVIPDADALTALACGRAVCQLVDAQAVWAAK